jgi:hypothetical protein
MEQAIKIAVDNGWRGNSEIIDGYIFTFGKRIVESEAQLDPSFWQSLGKGLEKEQALEELFMVQKEDGGDIIIRRLWWNVQWHRFIDHSQKEKTPRNFLILCLRNENENQNS